MPRSLKAWLRSLPLQRRVAYLTTVAVALAVAATSVAGYVTLRISLYDALDSELVDTATSVAAVSAAPEIQRLGGLTESALRAGNVSIAAYRADGKIYFVPDEREHLVLGPEELAIARLQRGYSARSGVSTSGEPFRIVAVPITELAGNYALVIGRPLQPTNDILSSLWLVLIIFGGVRRDRRRGGRRQRGALQPAAGAGAVRGGRARHRHQGAGPDQDRRQRRSGHARRVVQPDAPLARLLPRTPGPADRRRRARAAYAADQPAHQHRPALRRRPERHAERSRTGSRSWPTSTPS